MLKKILIDMDIDQSLKDKLFDLRGYIQDLYKKGYTKYGNQSSGGGSHQPVCPISVFHVAQKLINNRDVLNQVSSDKEEGILSKI
jgi:hypothetical protein